MATQREQARIDILKFRANQASTSLKILHDTIAADYLNPVELREYLEPLTTELRSVIDALNDACIKENGE